MAITRIDQIAGPVTLVVPRIPDSFKGPKGDTGAGVAAGGASNELLIKQSAADFDTGWASAQSLGLARVGANENVTGIWAGANARSLAALKARSVAGLTGGEQIALDAGGRSGTFRWVTGDQSAFVALDPFEGIWVAPDGQDGSNGAWRRVGVDFYVNVRWWGCVGNNSTDDGPRIRSLVNYLTITDTRAIIQVPPGRYRIFGILRISNETAGASNFFRNLTFQGTGGGFGSATVEAIFTFSPDVSDPDEVIGGLQIAGAVNVVFKDMGFRGSGAGAETLALVDAGIAPSGITTTYAIFERCFFRLLPTSEATEAMVWVKNTKNAAFKECRFSNEAVSLRIGDDQASNTGTLYKGAVSNIEISGCYFDGGLDIRHAYCTLVENCHFDNFIGPTQDIAAKAFSSGDGLMGQITFDTCTFVANQADASQANYIAIEQGSGQPDYSSTTDRNAAVPALVVKGCAFRTCRTAIVTKIGTADISGNSFTTRDIVPNATGYVGVRIEGGDVTLSDSNNFDGLVFKGGTSVINARGVTPDRSRLPRLINGSFQVWQRGTSFAHTGGFAYWADQWGGRRGANVAGVTVSRQTGDKAEFALRVQRDEADTSTQPIYLTTAMDSVRGRNWAGRKGVLIFRARKGANFSVTTLACAVLTGTGTDERINISFATGSQTAGSLNLTSANLTENWQEFVVPFTCASDIKQIGVRFSGTPSGTAGANDWFEVEQVSFQPGRIGGAWDWSISPEQELADCRRYFQSRAVYVPASVANLGFIDMRAVPTITGGGAGFNSTGTTKDTLVGFQTTAGVQTLLLSADI